MLRLNVAEARTLDQVKDALVVVREFVKEVMSCSPVEYSTYLNQLVPDLRIISHSYFDTAERSGTPADFIRVVFFAEMDDSGELIRIALEHPRLSMDGEMEIKDTVRRRNQERK